MQRVSFRVLAADGENDMVAKVGDNEGKVQANGELGECILTS